MAFGIIVVKGCSFEQVLKWAIIGIGNINYTEVDQAVGKVPLVQIWWVLLVTQESTL